MSGTDYRPTPTWWRWAICVLLAFGFGYGVILLLPPFFAAAFAGPLWATLGAAYAERSIRASGGEA